MAYVMGRSCGYGVHLRACFPPPSCSSTSSHSLASFTRWTSCFVLRFSYSSCRTRRLKLCAAHFSSSSSSSSSRNTSFLVQGEAEQARNISTSSAFRVRQLSATKRDSVVVKELDATEDLPGSSTEEVPAVAVKSTKRATRRKRVVEDSPSQEDSSTVASSEKAATPKKTSSRKKVVTPTTDISGSMMDPSADVPAATEGPPLAKSPRRKKRSSSADLQGKVEPISVDLEGNVESAGLVNLASSCTSSPAQTAGSGTSKKSIRKKRASSSNLQEDEVTMAAIGIIQDKKASVEASNMGIEQNTETRGTQAKIARRKKESSSSLLEVVSVGLELDTMQQKKEEKDLSVSSETLTLSQQDENPMPSSRRRSQSTESQIAAKTTASPVQEGEDELKSSDNVALTKAEKNMSVSSELQTLSQQDETPMPSRWRRQPAKRHIAAEPTASPFKEDRDEFISSDNVALSKGVQKKWIGSSTSFAVDSISLGSEATVPPLKKGEDKSKSLGNVGLIGGVHQDQFLSSKASLNIALTKGVQQNGTGSSTSFSIEDLSLDLETSIPVLKEGENESKHSGKVALTRGVRQDLDTASQSRVALTKDVQRNRISRVSSGGNYFSHLEKHGTPVKEDGDESESLGKVPLTKGVEEKWARSSTITSIGNFSLDSETTVPPLKGAEDDSKNLDKVAFTKGVHQNPTGSRPLPHRNEGSGQRWMDTARNTSNGQKQMLQEGAFFRAEGINRSKVFPTTSKKWDSSSQQQAEWNRNSTRDAAEDAGHRRETSFSKRLITNDRKETHLQQGYNLANVDRARGLVRKKRKEFFVRKVVANQASTISYMQILGTGFDTGDTMPTVLLFFDRRRFLFNVGEGLHRFCMEHRFKLSKIDHVFLTRVCAETVGGLPGLILTLADMNETGLTVKTWGPSSLDDLAQAMRIFVPSGWMEHTHTFGSDTNHLAFSKSTSLPPILLLEDELIKISAVLLFPEKAMDSKSEYVSVVDKRNGRMLSTVYICELSTVRGKFDPAKAQAKGIKPGHKYGLLQKGQSVLSDDGTAMVEPDDVLGPSSPGPIMFVVDCPSTSYVSSLTSSTTLQSFFSNTGKVVNCMIHIGPTSVTSSDEYQLWMENFKETHHVMARREVRVLGMPTLPSSARLTSKLNLVCPWLFPIVEFDAEIQKEPAHGRMVGGENLLKFRLRPLTDLGLDSSEVPEAFDHAAFQETWGKLSPEVIKARDMASQVWERWSDAKSVSSSSQKKGNRDCQSLPACLHQVSRDEMELVFLGTGSSQPSKHRNVTGIYIHLFEKGGVLLDCGEGTLAQLKRRYGAKGADRVILGLKCIWISHMHADHFTGISRILSARRQLLQTHPLCEPILVIGPRNLKIFLDAYGEIEDLVMEFLDCSQTTLEVQGWVDERNEEDRPGTMGPRREGLIRGFTRGASDRGGMQHIWKQPSYHVLQGIDMEGRKKLRKVLDLLGLKDLYSVPVIHCPQAFAVVLEAQERKISEIANRPGWKVVFSGDTRPCQALVKASQGATILIHEATFDDGLIAEAVKKNHSITNEAIEVGVSAGAYRIFLTHFSQRYPTIPWFDNHFSDRTCIAFDMMSVNLADLPLVPEFVPALQTLFRDQSDAEDEADENAMLSV